MRIGVDDGLQLSFLRAVTRVAVRMVAANQSLVGAADIGGPCRICEAKGGERLCVPKAGPAARRGGGLFFTGKQIMRIAEAEGRAALLRDGLLPAGQWGLGLVDLVWAEAIEKIVAGVEGADMIEAEELPAAGISRHAVGARGAKLAGQGAAGVLALRRLRPLDASVQAGALGAIMRGSGNLRLVPWV